MMKQIGCLVVDDEPIARDILKTYIAQLPQLQLLGDCKHAAEARQALHDFPVDVMFLDIRMPVTLGTAFLRSLTNPPLIVFTTAYSEHALEGFELNSVDYLLKPITFERFCQAVQKIQERMESRSRQGLSTAEPSCIFIRQHTKLLKVDFDDIIYIQAERDFCSVYLNNGKRLLASMHLKQLEESLPVAKFRRVHRSYILNLGKVRAIQGNVIETDHATIPIGSNYRESLFRALQIQ